MKWEVEEPGKRVNDPRKKKAKLLWKVHTMKDLFYDGLIKRGTLASFLLKNVNFDGFEGIEELDKIVETKKRMRRIEL